MEREGGVVARARKWSIGNARPSSSWRVISFHCHDVIVSQCAGLILSGDRFRAFAQGGRSGICVNETVLTLDRRRWKSLDRENRSESPPLPQRGSERWAPARSRGKRLLLNASRGGDLSVFPFLDAGRGHDLPRRVPSCASSENTPCSIFRGGLPRLSMGFMGTMPSLPFWRTKTAVEAW